MGKDLAWKWPEPLGRMGTVRGAGQSTETSCEGSRLTSLDSSQLVSLLWPAPYSVSSVLMAQAISEPNLFPYNTPNMSPAEFILHAPTCLWRWNRVFWNVGI